MATDDIALLTEHFGYPPVSLLDDIINSVNLLAERGLTSIETGLASAPPTSLGFGKPIRPRPPPRSTKKHPAPPPPPIPSGPPPTTPEEIAAAATHEIESGTHRLETLLCASIDRNFDLLELYAMRNILCVRAEDREWIRLGHYEGLTFDDDDDDGNDHEGEKTNTEKNDGDRLSVESVSNLRRRLQTSQRLNTALHAEKARNDALLGQLRALLGVSASTSATGITSYVKAEDAVDPTAAAGASVEGVPPLSFVRATGPLASVDARAPVATTAEFNLSQLGSVRALSDALRVLSPQIATQLERANQEAAARQGSDDGDDSDESGGNKAGWRAKRTRYVEAAARRHLEGSRGLELGVQGEVRDGEWQGSGRAVGRDEVERLEGIVVALGGVEGGRQQEEQEQEQEQDGDRMDES